MKNTFSQLQCYALFALEITGIMVILGDKEIILIEFPNLFHNLFAQENIRRFVHCCDSFKKSSA